MNNRFLGALALGCAPFLCVDMYLHGTTSGPQFFQHTGLSGFFSLLYISGWLCSMIALHRLRAMGESHFGRIITYVIFGTLTLANVWNVYEMIQPAANTSLYYALDIFWPISNLTMVGVGIAVIRAKRLKGWQRYVPLLCGLWFPLTMTLMKLLPPGLSSLAFHIPNAYTAIAWSLLALVVLKNTKTTTKASTGKAYQFN